MAASLLSKKSVYVVTGASRGLGRTIVLELSKNVLPGSVFVLLARNDVLLNEVAALIRQGDKIRAVTAVFDQSSSNQDALNNLLNSCLLKAEVAPNEFEQAVLINNAGSLEPLEFVRDQDNIAEISAHFQMNLVGYLAITSKFLQLFKSTVVDSRVVVNISSLAAISPMKSWGPYCMAKAGRDMMIKVLASEEEKIRALSYAPGPLPTDMLDIASEKTKDGELKQWFHDQLSQKTLVECVDSAKKLIAILEKNAFENGAHIDYYDDI
ncbi:sepiapterin reductase [Plakobranchus ocellatus]|uniref:Sepiapterin reductase n=1 Tax=Plakobranchus ocellatus TaxID=259542 RepID=A0AAV3ZA39_9GAST|nr:sepiapterin reductase [Plakobranchus ocellatus]